MKHNEKKLRRMIQEKELLISDQDFFLSPAFQNHMTSIARACTGQYNFGLQVLMDWDESEGAAAAFTDFYQIYCNAANPLSQSFPTRFLRALSIHGMTYHEAAHLLFTDYTALSLYVFTLRNGSFYPEAPSPSASHEQKNLNEILALLKAKDAAACSVLATCASDLENSIEDVYVEDRMCEAFPGTARQAIELNNYRNTEQIPDLSDQIADGYPPFAIVSNLLLAYCRSGEIPNCSGLCNEYTKALADCQPYVDLALKEGTMTARLQASSAILVRLWDFIRPLVEEQKKKQQVLDLLQALKELFGDQLPGRTPFPLTEEGNTPNNIPLPAALADEASPSRDAKRRKEDMEKIKDAVNEETERLEQAKTSHILDGSNPGATFSFQYEGSGYEKAASDMLCILKEAATERATEEYEQELAKELQKTAEEIRYGNAHRGIHITVNRMSVVPENLIQQYDQVAPALLNTSRRLQKTLLPLIKEETEGGKQKNLRFGKRLDMRSLYHEDGSYFIRTRLPNEEQRLAVALLLDESGSMNGRHRITHARTTALVLYDVCISLNIPVTIYGHRSYGDDVLLHSYAEFDSVDRQDKYRLMDIAAGGGNRDGAALRFVAEHLQQRMERQKLLILISDGQPAAYGYSGTAAEADLRGIKKEYTKKGIVLFAAAIGDDKETIQRIYGDGFLDITRLEDLPKNLTLLIKQYLK